MDNSNTETLISNIVDKKFREYTIYDVTTKDGNTRGNIVIVDILKLKEILKNIVKKSSYSEDEIDSEIQSIKEQLSKDYSVDDIKFFGNTITVPFILTAKLQNGKIIERTFGIKENGQQYTPEEIKVILKETEEVEFDEKFKDGRLDKFTFLSMIVDMNDKSIGENTKNPIRFITPDNKYKDKAYKEIQQAVNKAKQDYPNDTPPNILLIPYSTDEHIVILLVDKREFPNRNSVACFDSSHYFTKDTETLLDERYFCPDLYEKLANNKKQLIKQIYKIMKVSVLFTLKLFAM